MYILPTLWIKSYNAFLEKVVVINDYESLRRVLFCVSGCEWRFHSLGATGVGEGRGGAGRDRAGVVSCGT